MSYTTLVFKDLDDNQKGFLLSHPNVTQYSEADVITQLYETKRHQQNPEFLIKEAREEIIDELIDVLMDMKFDSETSIASDIKEAISDALQNSDKPIVVDLRKLTPSEFFALMEELRKDEDNYHGTTST